MFGHEAIDDAVRVPSFAPGPSRASAEADVDDTHAAWHGARDAPTCRRQRTYCRDVCFRRYSIASMPPNYYAERRRTGASTLFAVWKRSLRPDTAAPPVHGAGTKSQLVAAGKPAGRPVGVKLSQTGEGRAGVGARW